MGKYYAPETIICFIAFSTFGIFYIVNKSFSQLDLAQQVKPEYSWIIHGIQNILGYSTVIIPGYLIFKYTRKINYLDRPGSIKFSYIIRQCFGNEELPDHTPSSPVAQSINRNLLQDSFLLIFYFLGLQVSYLTWGILQEKVMTQEYKNYLGETGRFRDSQFLVFVNRILAFSLSGIIVTCTRQPRHKAPLYKYVYCSLSNIMSSWCQYEALKYVSFPHQVLAKAAKTIPVMIMGKIVSKTKYEFYEYVTACILSLGMLFFMLYSGDDNYSSTKMTTFFGIILLCSYIAFDSFTSNWQGALFRQYGMSSLQMMCAINLFSCIFTAVSLLQQDSLTNSFRFMMQFPKFSFDCLLLSVCSAGGQLFIFKTISTFGPLVFAIITTIRQGFSVLLSCLIYHHHISPEGIFGITLVFISIFLRIYCSYRLRKHKKLGVISGGVTKM